jgi:membrane-bound inhibitor of C-type lysozyme
MNRFHRVPAFLAVFPLAALLAGCESNGRGGGFDLSGLTGGGGNDRVEYRCDDDREFRVSYNDDRDRATVDAGDETWRLERTDQGGDRRVYGDSGVTLTVEGEDANLRVSGDDDYRDCEET